MPQQLETNSSPSVAKLVGGIVQDTQELLKQQLNLFQVEIKNDLARAIPFAVAAIVLLAAIVVLSLALAWWLPWMWPALPMWAGFAIAGGALALLGLGLLFWGKANFAKYGPLEHSVEALKENIHGTTRRTPAPANGSDAQFPYRQD